MKWHGIQIVIVCLVDLIIFVLASHVCDIDVLFAFLLRLIVSLASPCLRLVLILSVSKVVGLHSFTSCSVLAHQRSSLYLDSCHPPAIS